MESKQSIFQKGDNIHFYTLTIEECELITRKAQDDFNACVYEIVDPFSIMDFRSTTSSTTSSKYEETINDQTLTMLLLTPLSEKVQKELLDCKSYPAKNQFKIELKLYSCSNIFNPYKRIKY